MTALNDHRLSLFLCLVTLALTTAATGPQALAADAPAKAPATAAASQPALKPAAADKSRAPGLVGQYFKGVTDLSKFPTDKPPFFVHVDTKLNVRRRSGQFNGSKLSNNFGVRWNGYIHIDKPGSTTFVLKSDDGSRLYIGDQLVIDNAKPEESMKEKESAATFSARGDYPIRLEYFNASGAAGINLSWKNPQGKTVGIGDKNLLHDANQEQVTWAKAAWDKEKFSYKKWAEKYGENFDKMDYGPFFCATIAIDAAADNHATKGIAIHLGKSDIATICFDTDLMRWAGGWTGGFLDNHGVVFDGQHGVNPGPDGEMMFIAPALPGAALGGTSEKMSKDPRPHPYGSLPHEWAKYKGMYLHGNRVVVHYTVGDVDVFDSPWAKQVGPEKIQITRTIKLSASDQPLTMLLDKPIADHPMQYAFTGKVEFKTIDHMRYVVFPPRKEATTYGLTMMSGDSPISSEDVQAENLDELVTPGPARWGAPIATKCEVAKSTTQPYVVDTITAPEDNPYHSWLRFGGMDFFADGKRAAITTWSGDVWIVSGIDDKLENVQWKRFATGLFQPLGLKIVDDTIYVLGRDQITRLHDTNNDGEADFYECFNNDCQVTSSFHEFAFDLQTDPEGNFYYTKAGPVRPGGRGWQVISDNNGSMLRVSKDGSKFEVFATGLRAPNGMCVGPKGQVTVADNEGTWTPACRLSFVHKGDFLGVVDLAHTDPLPKTYDPPLFWLPHGDVDNSSGGQVWVSSDNKWGPFEDRLLHTSYGKCALFLTMLEEVDGKFQGGVVQFPKLDFISGICRPRFNPVDHQLYMTGLRGWQTTATKDCGFQRVRYTGAAVKMPTELHVKHDGVAVTFTAPLDPSVAVDAGNYSVEQWNLLWSSDYGSPEFSVAEPKTKAHDPVDVEKVTLSPDHKTVFLKLDAVVPVMQMKIQMKLKAADGTPMDYSIYNTINRVPKGEKAPATAASAQN